LFGFWSFYFVWGLAPAIAVVAAVRALALVAREAREVAAQRGQHVAALVEALAVTVVAERARERVGPLRLVRVDVDAVVALLVRPAACELLSTDAAERLGGGALRLALRHLRAAAGTRARNEEAFVLARARHAELHLALVAPLVSLLVDRVANEAGHRRSLGLCILLEPLSRLLRRLAGAVGRQVALCDVTPAEALVLHLAALERVEVHERVRLAVPRALGAVVRRVHLCELRRARHNPRAVLAVPDGETLAIIEGEEVVAALAAGALVKVLVGLGVPGAVEDVVGRHCGLEVKSGVGAC